MYLILGVLLLELASFALGNFWAFTEFHDDYDYFKFYDVSHTSLLVPERLAPL